MKRLIIFLTIFIISMQMCFAKEPVEICIDFPNDFPKQQPLVGNYTPKYKIHAFVNKWFESILSTNQTVNFKLLDKTYEGVGYIFDNEFEYDPPILFSNGSTKIDCKLYSGLVNKSTYSKLKSPLLYDSKNHVCVAVEGWRDYSKIDSYFIEPAQFEKIIYVAGPKSLSQTKIKPFSLQEVILLPENIDSKKEKKYIKEVSKIYNNTLNTAINENNSIADFCYILLGIILLPFAILGGI